MLADLLKTEKIVRFKLTKIFRQAQESKIISYAHEINSGVVPKIISPLANPKAFKEGIDCLFLDADEATQEQTQFIQRAKQVFEFCKKNKSEAIIKTGHEYLGKIFGAQNGEIEYQQVDYQLPQDLIEENIKDPVMVIPEKFKHVNLLEMANSQSFIKDLSLVLKNIHPWSSLHFGLTALDSVVRLYTKTIPELLGPNVEIQVLTPQNRGTLGTVSLNQRLQQASNPQSPKKAQIVLGEKVIRVGDRVIQTKNNYDLGVYNGDIGTVVNVDIEELSCEVLFFGGNENKTIIFEKDDISELSLAYAITIHKSQGSEFQVVIIPVLGQHYNMLFRNLIYTGLTRAKKLAIFVGSRKAFALAIGKIDNRKRQTALTQLLN